MSRQEAATQLFMSAPPASIDVVIEQLERDAQAAGIDIHTISVMASLLRDRIEAYSDVLKIEPERVIHALEVLRGTEVPWAFYNVLQRGICSTSAGDDRCTGKSL